MTNADKIRTKTCHDCIHPKVCAWWYEYAEGGEFGYDLYKICPYFEEGENEKTKRKSCYDCKHHFMSDIYLECDYVGAMNDCEICESFEEDEK